MMTAEELGDHEEWKAFRQAHFTDASCRLAAQATREMNGDREAAFELLMMAAQKMGSMAISYWSNRATPPLELDEAF